MAEVLPAPTTREEHLTPPSLSDPPTPAPTPHKSFYVPPTAPSAPIQTNFDTLRDSTDDDSSYDESDYSSHPLRLRRYSRTASFYSSSSSVSLDSADKDDVELSFPSYDDTPYQKQHDAQEIPQSPCSKDSFESTPPSLVESTPTVQSVPTSPDLRPLAGDDSAVQEEPSRQVDYLSHDWREEDIWSSWKHIVSKRKRYGEVSRLENASWRTWAKCKFQLRTVSPERLNWMKECDVTWLYGPLQPGTLYNRNVSESTAQLSKTSSFLNKKPILKKRSVSEVMLQKSLSSSSLVKQAAAVVQAQRTGKPRQGSDDLALAKVPSDFIISDLLNNNNSSSSTSNTGMPSTPSSGLQTPDGGKRHIRFDNTVEQCIAVDFKEGFAEDELEMFEDPFPDEASDDELVMMKSRPRRSQTSTPTPGSSRGSFSQESKGIAMLPSTTIKFHDDPECPGHDEEDKDAAVGARPSRLLNSPSQETLRPARPYANFLLEDEDDGDVSWEPAGAFGKTKRDSDLPTSSSSADPQDEMRQGLRRTASGMFMPLEDDSDEESYAPGGILGRAVDTVNTFRDIAHVIWNVGWRK